VAKVARRRLERTRPVEVRALASREGGSDRVRRRVHRESERCVRVVDESRFAQRDPAQVPKKRAVAGSQLPRYLAPSVEAEVSTAG